MATTKQVCKFHRSESDMHAFTGTVYKCEDCRLTGCKECILADCWEERCRDNIFLCNRCYRMYQNRMDIG